MCGIAGIFHKDRDVASDASGVHRMLAAIGHRGPDASGAYVDGPVVLGHARLSIIDLEGGAQPMSTLDGALTITFNGEIFNYVELREDLAARGYQFATRSDTEVILRAYEEYGDECVHRMNGQWAFAIWDKRRKRLFISRDRLGIRPLFYTESNGRFLFASEMKALFADPAVPRKLDLKALAQVFTFWVTLPPRTTFEGVCELPPGHSMSLQDGKVSVTKYWEAQYAAPYEIEDDSRTEQSYSEELWDLLLDATRIRLRADVPVGSYLSGGLDSSATTMMAKKFTDTSVTTFSVAFENPEFDESKFQSEVARHLGTEHHVIRCSSDSIGKDFPKVVWHAEKPLIRTAPVPLFQLSGLVRQHGFKVVLSGEGSDEVLGGYDIFKEAKVRAWWARRPESKLRPMLLRRLYPYMPALQKQSDAALRGFFHSAPEHLDNLFFSHLPRWELTAKLQMLFSADTRAQLGDYNPYDELSASLPADFHRWNAFQKAQYLELKFLMPGYILASQGDRMAMGHSVEIRMPFLDYRVVEFAGRLPVQLKMKVLKEKYLLKKCMAPHLPPSVLRRPKQPYRAPDGESLFSSAARPYVDEALAADRVADDGIFDSKAVGVLASKFAQRRASSIKDNMALVGVLSTQLLQQQYVRQFHDRVGKIEDADSRATAAVHR